MTDDTPRLDGAASPLPADAVPTSPDGGPGPDAAPLAPPPAPDDAVATAVAAEGGAAATSAASDGAIAPADAPAASRRSLAFAAAAVVGIVAIGALLVAGWNSASTTRVAADPGAAPVLGAATAPVLVEVWADYQCPYCGALTHVLEPSIQRDYVDTGKVRMVFRDFSFLGQESTEAAAAARCAGQQDAYWLFHDLLFASQQGENQGAFAPANIVKLATYAGLDLDTFATCMSDPAVRTAVEAETAQGRAFGVESTPTLRIVGPAATKVLKGLTTLAVVDAAIAEALTGVAPSPAPGASGAPSDTPASSPSPGPASSAAPSVAPPGASTAP